MRQSKKKSRSKVREGSARWVYWILAGGAMATLAWLWWGHSQPRVPGSAPAGPATNRIIRLPDSAPSPLSSTTAAPVVRTNVLIAPLVTPPEPAPEPAAPAGVSSSPSSLTQSDTTNTPPAETPVAPKAPTFDRSFRATLELQIALARSGISPGCIDGRFGSQTRAAVRAYQQREGLSPSGEPDPNTRALLRPTEPVLTTHTVTWSDIARLTKVGRTWLEKSQQDRLDYESILELVAEKGHAHQGLLRTLNPGIDWTAVSAGAVVNLPLVHYPSPRSKAAFVRIRLGERTLQAFDLGTNLLAHFPCSIAQRVEKRPVGRLYVEKIAANPNYRFDPDIFPESAEARALGRVLMIPPGPNNPVGTAWIGLSRPGYGIHGTPRPEDVGRTESHGCFRLANWDATYLLQLVSVGTPVLVEP